MDSGTSPLVSVVIPAHNVGAFVHRCIESVCAQTYRQLEIVVVDDASRDDTAAVIDRSAASDSRVKPLHLSTNAGVHGARAAGLQIARGEYLGFVDADDWVAPGMFRQLLDAISSERADIALCGVANAVAPDQLAGAKVEFRERKVFADGLLERFTRLEFGSGVLWNKLYRREVLVPHALRPLERAVDAAEDYIVNFGAFAAARRVVTLPEALYFYRLDPGSATRRASKAASFCRTVRAYVVCLETYAPEAPGAAAAIDELYVRQLRFDSYTVGAPAEFQPYAAHLAESLARLGRIHPTGLYSLVHAFDLPVRPAAPVAVRPAVRELGKALKGVGRALRARSVTAPGKSAS